MPTAATTADLHKVGPNISSEIRIDVRKYRVNANLFAGPLAGSQASSTGNMSTCPLAGAESYMLTVFPQNRTKDTLFLHLEF
jgi:hypothetical protein